MGIETLYIINEIVKTYSAIGCSLRVSLHGVR